MTPRDDGAIILPGASPCARVELDRVTAAAAELAQERLAPRTRRAYATDWATFIAWCETHGLAPLPASPELVATYLAALVEEGLRYSTIDRALTGIAHFQKRHDPTWLRGHHVIAAVMKGIRHKLGAASEKKDPLDDVRLREVVTRRPATVLGTLERAVLLVGWLSSLRRSALVALDVTHATFVRLREDVSRLVLHVERDKQDQAGIGRDVGIEPAKDPALCAVRALDAWLTVMRRPKDGPLFRVVDGRTGELTDRRLRPEHVAEIVKRAVLEVGIDPSTFAGHSLRRGFATTAAGAGVAIDAIQRQTGHRSLRILIEDYIKPATVFSNNATKGLV